MYLCQSSVAGTIFEQTYIAYVYKNICAKCEYNQKLSMKNHSFQSIVLCFF